MVKYLVKVLVDTDVPFKFVDIGLTPYIISLDVKGGGKVAEFWQNDGMATLELNNADGLFNPHNIGSAFYEKLLTKRRVQILLNDEVFWTGVIEQLTPELDKKKPRAILELSQGIQNVKDIYLTGDVYQDKNGNELAQALLVDNGFVPISAKVFTIGYSLIGDDLTEDIGALITNEIPVGTTYPYASDTWDSEVSLYKALTEVLETEQSYAMFNRKGQILLLPFYWMKVSALAGTEGIDTVSVKANFKANPNIVNEALVSYYTRLVITNTEVISTVKDVNTDIEISLPVVSLATEEKRVILGNVVLDTGGGSVSVVSNDARKVVVKGLVDADDVDIVIKADILTIEKKEIVTVENAGSKELYRYTYTDTIDYKLAPTHVTAVSIGNRTLARYAQPFTYIEEMSFVDYYPYQQGDVVLINSSKLPSVGSKHLIVGEKHTLVNDTMKTTYYMVGADSAPIFIIGDSLISGVDILI